MAGAGTREVWGDSGCYLDVIILGEPYEIANMFVDKNGNFMGLIKI